MRFEVTVADTAQALGSGDVPVLGTPRLLAWMEAATVAAAGELLEVGETTVGTAVRLRHRRPTRVGGTVEVVATLQGPRDGHRLRFTVLATDAAGEVVGEGEIDRVVVDGEHFLAGAG